MKNNKIHVRPVSNFVGAEITGVNLGEPLTDFSYQIIRRALCEWGVLFFREQNITPAQHLDFGKRFGELPDIGGDTLFANISSSYEKLSNGMKMMLEGLSAVHAKKKALQSSNLSAERQVSTNELEKMGGAVEEQFIHPVVVKHPQTGRKILYVNPTYTVRFDGWTEQESKPLLQFLFEQGGQPEKYMPVRLESRFRGILG